jgi:N-acyl-D-aspartate/D-glutamate deacylase
MELPPICGGPGDLPESAAISFVPPGEQPVRHAFNRHSARFLFLLAVAACTAMGAAKPAAAQQMYDVLIRNGRILDGTGNPWFTGDVAIQGDRIVAVARHIAGDARRTIDASGKFVAPGFIDIHSHSDDLLLEDGDAASKVLQGVTTEVLGEGESNGPFVGQQSPRAAKIGGEAVQWTTLGGYFDILERAGVAVNVASYVGLNSVWECVMGTSFERPSPDQLQQMQSLVEQAMQEGALGLSSQVMMPPGSLAQPEEVIGLCRVVAKYHGIYSTHIRNEGTGVFDSVKEAIHIAESAGVPLDIIHLKIADQRFWGRMAEVIALIDEARQRGSDVQANVYPYTRGNNNLVSIIPPWAHEGGKARLIERLRDPEQRERLKRDIRGEIPGWYNHFTAVGGDWSRILISGENAFKGLTMDRVLALRTQGKSASDPLDELFDLLIEEDGSIGAVYAHHMESDMALAMRQPWCSIGSDGSAYATTGPLRRGNPHPRNFGTFPRVLGVYVRQQRQLTWEDAVRKMTSLNAAKIGLRDRGLLVPGNFADITIFDPQRVIDRATYTEPFQYSEGIEYVLVNGQLVLDQGTPTHQRPGRALRYRAEPMP